MQEIDNSSNPLEIEFVSHRLRAWFTRYWPGLLFLTWLLLLFLARQRGVFFDIPEKLRPGVLRSDPKGVPGFIQDPFYTIWQFFWIPFAWLTVYALHSVQKMVSYFASHSDFACFGQAEERFMSSFLEKTQRAIGARWQWALAAVAALAAIGLQINMQLSRIESLQIMYWWDWRLSKPVYIIRLIMVGLDVFLAVIMIYRGTLSVVFTKRFLGRINLIPRPLHPDKAGGLGIIGKVCLSFTWPMLVIGIVLASSFFFHEETTYFVLNTTMLALYVVSITFVFFFPLSSVHKVMRRAKEDWLDKISLRIRSILNVIEERLEGDQENPLRSFNELELLRKQYEIVESMPVWPYDFKTISRFFSTILIPVLMFAAEVVINLF